jgi:hypothetical protein
MYPPKGVDEVFGCQMDNGVGSLVYNAWRTLFLHDKIDEKKVTAAIATGRLPAFFEATCRSLGDQGSHYTARLCGRNVHVRFRLPAGDLFKAIPWDIRTLFVMMAEDSAAKVISDAPDSAASRRLAKVRSIASDSATSDQRSGDIPRAQPPINAEKAKQEAEAKAMREKEAAEAKTNGKSGKAGKAGKAGNVTNGSTKRRAGGSGRPWQCFLSAFIIALAVLAGVMQIRASVGMQP